VRADRGTPVDYNSSLGPFEKPPIVLLVVSEGSMKLVCVRHGETLHNAEGRIQGQSDSQLSPLGRLQCTAVAAALAGQKFDAVIASPLSRARETAECIAEQLALAVEFDPRLMEIHAGVFQGLCWHEIDAHFPDDAVRWRSHDVDYCIPAGESRRDLMRRAEEAFFEIRERGYGAALIVAHGGSLSAAFKALLGIPPERSPFALANASISTVLWEKDFKLISLNETGHLAGLAARGGDL
jgi:broad specificity phosphatase PhoE